MHLSSEEKMPVQNFNQKLYAGGAAAFLLLLLLGLGFTQTSSSPDSFPVANTLPTANPLPVPGANTLSAANTLKTQLLICQPEEEERNDGLLQNVFNSTLGFQKIFVINMASRTDHRDSMSLAAALSGIQVEYLDGVSEVLDKTLPPGGIDGEFPHRGIPAWRAHMNAVRKIVEQNLTSALILEDDVDWDVRIKSQLQDFAQASRLLLQPLRGTSDQYLDPSYPHPTSNEKPKEFNIDWEHTSEPSSSPYGDVHRWDLLWLGHCGAQFPQGSDEKVPHGRVVMSNDKTVPEPQHIAYEAGSSELMNKYPAHTRIVSRAKKNVCTLAYAMTQKGARRMLYELGVHKMDAAADVMFHEVCDGTRDRRMGTCLSVQPQLFQHHRPVGAKSSFSEIQNHGTAYNEIPFSRNIRWSVHGNFEQLINDETDYVDLWQDGQEARKDIGFG